MLARYYSAGLGRFLSVDPGGDPDLEDPQSWNRYSYVFNNPLRYNDPTGEDGNDVANAIDSYVSGTLASVDANTGGGPAGVVANALAGTVGDMVSGTADLLRVGAATGETIGEGKGGTDLASAISKDVGRAAGLFVAMGAVAAPLAGSVSRATEVAAQGGEHSGFLKNLENQGSRQLRKTDASLGKRISEHKGLLRDAKKAGNKGLVKHYKSELKTFRAQRSITRDVIRSRK